MRKMRRIIFLTGTPYSLIILMKSLYYLIYYVVILKRGIFPLDIHTQRKIDQKEIKKILNKLKLF